MKITPTLDQAQTVDDRAESAATLIRRHDQLSGELEATRRWIEKLSQREQEITAELKQIQRDLSRVV